MIEDVFVSVVRIDRIVSTQSHSLPKRIFCDLDSTKLSRVRCSIILVKMDRAPYHTFDVNSNVEGTELIQP